MTNQEEKRAAWLEQAFEYIQDYVSGLRTQRVVPDATAIERFCDLDIPLPEQGLAGEAVLKQLHQIGSPGTIAQGGGRYFGFVNGGHLPIALAAKSLGDAWDQNAAMHVMSPISDHLEKICARWLVDLLGLPVQTHCSLVSGTTTATLCALAAARYRQLDKLGWNLEQEGLYGAPKLRLILPEVAHASVYKALTILGFGQSQIEKIACDEQGRMLVDRLPPLDERCIVLVQAGNVCTGAFDRFEAIMSQCELAGAWVHVDGAFGLWAAAVNDMQALTQGMARAQSWACDAHKTLNVGYDCGLFLCRDREAIAASLSLSGSYVSQAQAEAGMNVTLDMSRRARSVELWAVLAHLGAQGVDDLVSQLHRRAQQAAEGLQKAGIQVLNEVVFNQCLFALDTDAQTQDLIEAIQASGQIWLGSATWQGRTVARLSVCSWATSEADIEFAIKLIADLQKQVEQV